tara:strand:+ start:1917 stop:2468 length:552 start_codon:yes stop_codon:yes gene_type:complete
MTASTIYLFDNKKHLKKISNKTLFVKFSESHFENYNLAQTRKKIQDWQGALLFVNQAIRQNKFVEDYYILKMEIYLELNQFDYAVVNSFKAYLSAGRELDIEESKVMVVIKMYYINFNEDFREKFKSYLDHYSKLFNHSKNINEFALKLAKLDFFSLDSKVNNEEHKYGLFLELQENSQNGIN